MHYKLLGFSQSDTLRRLVFKRILGDGTAATEFTVVTDVRLARKFGIASQELPSLCSRLIESRADDGPSAIVFLTEADLEVHAAANESAAQQDRAKRALRSRRGAPAAATRTAKQHMQLNSSAVAEPLQSR